MKRLWAVGGRVSHGRGYHALSDFSLPPFFQ